MPPRVWLRRLSWRRCEHHGFGRHGPQERLYWQARRTHRWSKCAASATLTAHFMRQYNPSLRVDQVAEYYTSVHGKRLKELKDPKVATCASCHKPHSIRPANDARSSVHPLHVAETCGSCHANKDYMASYKIPTDQVEKYKKSVHWKMISTKGDLSAPTCNDCHGNHGAAPPGVSSVVNVCGQCHVVNCGTASTRVRIARSSCRWASPVAPAVIAITPSRTTSDAMLGAGDKSACATCHPPTSSGATLAASMLASIDRLKNDYERSQHAARQCRTRRHGSQPAVV